MKIIRKLPEWERIAAGQQKSIYLPITTQWELRLGQGFGVVYQDGKLLRDDDLPEFMRKDPEQLVMVCGGWVAKPKILYAVCCLRAENHHFILDILRVEKIDETGKGRKYDSGTDCHTSLRTGSQ